MNETNGAVKEQHPPKSPLEGGLAEAAPDAPKQASGDFEHTLKYPYTLATGVRLEKVTLRRAKVRDLKRAQRMAGTEPSMAEIEIAVLSVICSPPMTPEDFDEMDGEDFAKLQGFLR